jgi:hypothetical protein
MNRLLDRWFRLGSGRACSGRDVSRRRRRSVPLACEGLEGRQLMTVTNHGGGVLPNVEIQGLFYGSDWASNTTYKSQSQNLSRFLGDIVSGSYMDMLTAAGYGVGRGTSTASGYDAASINKSAFLTDTQIQAALSKDITNGTLASPDYQRLYVVFVEDNVAVNRNGTQSNVNSSSGFAGYHDVYTYNKPVNGGGSIPFQVHYAVIAYPGGSVGNNQVSWLDTQGNMTAVASHEIAESVTDPNYSVNNVQGKPSYGWYDDAAGQEGEVGDLVAYRDVYLDGFAVQRIADQNDMPMTPSGAQPKENVSFGLDTSGNLYLLAPGGGKLFIKNTVASVSDQGIDDQGHAMVDIVYTDGTMAEYHAGSGSFVDPPVRGVKAAKAGQGVSYILLNNGIVEEYIDATQTIHGIDTNVSAIDAGTDGVGDNCVGVIYATGKAAEWGDGGSYHNFGPNIKSLSIGLRGQTAYLDTSNTAYTYLDGASGPNKLGSGITQITAGPGPGFYDVLQGGTLYDFSPSNGFWKPLVGGVTSIAKQSTFLDVNYVNSSGLAWQINTLNPGFPALLGVNIAHVS